MNPPADTTETPNAPTIHGDQWRSVSIIGSQRLYVDHHGNMWLTYHDDGNPRLITRDEGLAIAERLAEEFGLVVVNPPAAWGWSDEKCGCDTVPDRVECSHCGNDLHLSDERLPWGEVKS